MGLFGMGYYRKVMEGYRMVRNGLGIVCVGRKCMRWVVVVGNVI